MAERVLITGGSRGIGLSCVRLFLERGYEVVTVARSFDSFSLNHVSLTCVPMDLAEVGKIPFFLREHGPFAIVVNNAAIMNRVLFHEYGRSQMETMMAVNLQAPVMIMQEAFKGMESLGGGRIVNVASIAGYTGHPDVWYGITKAGLLNATKSFATLLAPKNIQVNAVAPGPVNTDMLATIPRFRLDQLKEQAYNGCFAEPDEVAATIFWLAAESPAHVSGMCLDVNCGAYPR